MLCIPAFKGQKIGVLGLGRSGQAAAEALKASGATPLCWDDSAEKRQDAQTRGFSLLDASQENWSEITRIVMSPGIAHTYPAPHPFAARAHAERIPLISDVQCFFEIMHQASVIGITGTNGKSTTSALIASLLKSCEQEVALGGNIGTPVLSLPSIQKGFYVLELSSYQLELVPSPDLDVAIILNLSPDHLDRHGGLEGYIAAKKRIVCNRSKPCKVVIGIDDALCMSIYEQFQKEKNISVIPISTTQEVAQGIYVQEGILKDTLGEDMFEINLNNFPHLKGVHNHQNAAASYAVLKFLGFQASHIHRGFTEFSGLVHRQERVGVWKGITYINDSKATNAQATRMALETYHDTAVYCILGGRSKEGGLELLAPLLSRVAHCFLIGEAAEEFGVFLALSNIPFTLSYTLEVALEAATQQAQEEKKSNPVVLLSPACASFDQFRDFEERGNFFRHWVKRRTVDAS